MAADLAPIVQRLADSAGAAAVPGQPVSGGANSAVIADSRNNSLLVKAGSPARMASIRSLVERLDQPPQGSAAAGNVWVVHLKNADASKLAQVLRAAFGGDRTAVVLTVTPIAGASALKGTPLKLAAELGSGGR